MTPSRPVAHFERLYQESEDPWRFASSDYEQAKYAETIRMLGGRHFVSGLEVGCSIGVLTRLLAPHCGTLLGLDCVERPLHSARKRCAALPSVQFAFMEVPASWPDGRFDLILLSEILYYFAPDDLATLVNRVSGSLFDGGIVLLVHWLGPLDDPASGDEASQRFIAAFPGTPLEQCRQTNYRIDLLSAGSHRTSGQVA